MSLTSNPSPILFRVFHMLTPSSELPTLPNSISSYLPIHAYTIFQILLTTGIFILTLTKIGPVFPMIIIALVPIRLLVMNRMWNRETLRYVDGWACREGTPEDDEDRKMNVNFNSQAGDFQLDDVELETVTGSERAVESNVTSSLTSMKT